MKLKYAKILLAAATTAVAVATWAGTAPGYSACPPTCCYGVWMGSMESPYQPAVGSTSENKAFKTYLDETCTCKKRTTPYTLSWDYWSVTGDDDDGWSTVPTQGEGRGAVFSAFNWLSFSNMYDGSLHGYKFQPVHVQTDASNTAYSNFYVPTVVALQYNTLNAKVINYGPTYDSFLLRHSDLDPFAFNYSPVGRKSIRAYNEYMYYMDGIRNNEDPNSEGSQYLVPNWDIPKEEISFTASVDYPLFSTKWSIEKIQADPSKPKVQLADWGLYGYLFEVNSPFRQSAIALDEDSPVFAPYTGWQSYSPVYDGNYVYTDPDMRISPESATNSYQSVTIPSWWGQPQYYHDVDPDSDFVLNYVQSANIGYYATNNWDGKTPSPSAFAAMPDSEVSGYLYYQREFLKRYSMWAQHPVLQAMLQPGWFITLSAGVRKPALVVDNRKAFKLLGWSLCHTTNVATWYNYNSDILKVQDLVYGGYMRYNCSNDTLDTGLSS